MLCQSNFGCVATLITMMPTALTVIYPIMVSCVFRLCLQRSLYLSFFTLFCIPAFSLLLNGVAQLGFQLLSVFLSLNFHLSLMCLCYFFQRFLSFLVFRLNKRVISFAHCATFNSSVVVLPDNPSCVFLAF